MNALVGSIADWMEQSLIHNMVVAGHDWLWPVLETFHFIGMCLLLGGVIVMDFRLIGWARAASVSGTDRLSGLAQAGFAINLLTGLLFIFGDPHRYFVNPSFQMKMFLILLAGVNMIYYKSQVAPKLAVIGSFEAVPARGRLIGAASLVLWVGVICGGRLIPYFGVDG